MQAVNNRNLEYDRADITREHRARMRELELEGQIVGLRKLVECDLRVRQLELNPKFTAHDAALLISGAYGACVFALVVAYCQGLVL